MNKNTPQEMIAVIQAHLDGKKLQFWSQVFGDQRPGRWEDVLAEPVFAFNDTIYRVKPSPKRIPLTQEDIPLDRPVWIKTPQLVCELIVGIESRGVHTRSQWLPFEALMKCSYYISFDGGKTWQRCEKEVAE